MIVVSHGYCSKHWTRLKRTGSLEATVLRGPDKLEARYWQKVDKRGPDECWPWTAMVSSDGYGKFSSPTDQLAHRFGYTLANGPIPDGLVVDHTCHDPRICDLGTQCPHRRCQNPAHMAAVEPLGNTAPIRRRTRADATHCKWGHPFSEENTRVRVRGTRRTRVCLTCEAASQVRHWMARWETITGQKWGTDEG